MTSTLSRDGFGEAPATPSGRPDRFYVAMATVALVIAMLGFLPSSIDTSARRGPISLDVALHGTLFTGWLVLFLVQSALVRSRNLALHRRLGYACVALAILMVISGSTTAIGMARRGYDLSGDLIHPGVDPLQALIFPLGDVVSFAIVVLVAVLLRRHSGTHKRLMLLATLGTLMPTALAHIIGHSQALRSIQGPIILLPLTALLATPAIHDYVSERRIHPVSISVAAILLAWTMLRGALIATSTPWHQIASWLIL